MKRQELWGANKILSNWKDRLTNKAVPNMTLHQFDARKRSHIVSCKIVYKVPAMKWIKKHWHSSCFRHNESFSVALRKMRRTPNGFARACLTDFSLPSSRALINPSCHVTTSLLKLLISTHYLFLPIYFIYITFALVPVTSNKPHHRLRVSHMTRVCEIQTRIRLSILPHCKRLGIRTDYSQEIEWEKSQR